MPDPKEIKETPDNPDDGKKKPELLSSAEQKIVQEEATRASSDRAAFLKGSLGKAFSPSTEYLKDMVVNIVDSAEKIDLAATAVNDLSLKHPIDSAIEIGKRLFGSSPETGAPEKAEDAGAKQKDKPAEAAKAEEKPEEALKKIKDDPDTKAQREKLEKLAEEKIKDPAELKKFKEDMEALEKRASEQKPPLKPEDIKGTYREIAKLMDTADGPDVPIKSNDRVKLAEQVMRQAAHPTDISQGEYNTCNTTTVEVRTYTKNPAEAARLVADVATSGKYTSNGNPPVTVEIDKDSLKRHGQSATDIVADNKRTYASQIFEVTATNVYYKGQHEHQHKDDIRYEQHEPKAAGPNNKPPADNGERLYNYSKLDKNGKPTEVTEPHNDKIPVRHPNLGDPEIAEINRQINKEAKDGTHEGPVLIGRESDDPKQAERVLELKNKLYALELHPGDATPIDLNNPDAVQKVRDTINEKEKSGQLDAEKAQKLRDGLDLLLKEKNKEYRNDNGVVIVHSPEEMEKTLAQMKAEGRLPAIISVSASKEPFRSDNGGHATGDLGGGHVVTVTDYHPAENGKPATVDVDNQWGKSADRSMTVKDLYEAQEKPKGPVLEKLEALEKQYAAGDFKGKEAEYDKELQKLYLEEIKLWDAAKGSGNQDKETLAIETLKDSLRHLEPSPSRGKKIMDSAIADYKKQKAAGSL
ncbi:MAG: hypothetical protein K2X27_01780 [Candidatus Obscuribacterales bacterium]|nr:hypothetical protein [Candidatus Obscuribacterales bacterium]